MVNCYDFSLCSRTGPCTEGGGRFRVPFQKKGNGSGRARGGGFHERALMDSQSALVEVGVA